MAKSKVLGREEIRGYVDKTFGYVEAFGGTVKLRRMTSRERDQFDIDSDRIEKETGSRLTNFSTRLVVAAVCDDADKLLFTTEDIGWLGDKSHVDVRLCYRKAAEVNGFSKEAEQPDPKASSGQGKTSSST